MCAEITEYEFNDRRVASEAAADRLSARLRAALQDSANATLLVTGGSSPRDCYARLAATPLPWQRVTVVPSDERWVPTDHEDSNERMVRTALLRDEAANTRLQSLYSSGRSPIDRCDELTDELKRLPQPFAACLLGMGTDGHVASLFADAPTFEQAIAAEGTALCVPVATAASEHLRISLTLPALLLAKEIVLLFFGEEKLAVYRRALTASCELPVSRILAQSQAPVSVYWAP